ncbi:MAG: IclR family transcriptional regulator [Actinomycetota bacterium]|nr:IclR family transcriptional regulator [Actinomycetota bacterium]MDA8360226.1 IclR family transcriptional regulator [Actinomycetota bacterium]
MSQTVDRALQIIEYFSERPRSLTEIAEHEGVHKSTALRLLQTLEYRGFARRDAEGRYLVGFRMVELSQRAVDHLDILAIAHPRLVTLSRELGHTLHLGQLEGNEVIYVDKVEGTGAVKMYSRVGGSAIVYTSGVAKAIVAYLDEPRYSHLLQSIAFTRYTATTLTTIQDFEAELERTRQRGWAEDNSEFEETINCVAVPIRNNRGLVRHAISLTALRALAPLESLRECVPRLRAEAEAISKEYGWIG